MAKLFNRAKMTTASTGTGTVTLGSAATGFQTFAKAGVSNSDVIQYVIDNIPGVPITYTKNDNPKPHCYDMADSWVIAKAGWLDWQAQQR